MEGTDNALTHFDLIFRTFPSFPIVFQGVRTSLFFSHSI